MVYVYDAKAVPKSPFSWGIWFLLLRSKSIVEVRPIPSYLQEAGQKPPISCKKWENSNHRILYIGHCRVFLDSLGGLLLVSSLQIQDRLQMLKAAFEFCLCNSEPSPAFSSCLNSNTAEDIMTVSTLPAFFVKQSVCHRDPLWWMLEYFLQGKCPYGMYTALRPTQDVVTLWKDN